MQLDCKVLSLVVINEKRYLCQFFMLPYDIANVKIQLLSVNEEVVK